MYQRIVARRTTQVFDALNRGDAGPLLSGLADPAHHEMGDGQQVAGHALGGSRDTVPAIGEWYARLFRLLPDLRFDVRSVRVSGAPWATTVVVEWADSALDGTYENAGVNTIGIRWGKVHSIAIACDTGRLADRLDELAGEGVEEAAAGPVSDAAPGPTGPGG